MEQSQSAFTIPSQLGKHARPLPQNDNQGGPGCPRGYCVVLGLHTFKNFPEKKINIAAVNISRSRPIICVNS